MNITPVECVRIIINLLYFSLPPKHTFLSGQAHLPYVDINSHSPKHTFLSGWAHLPYVDISSHSPKHTFLSGRAHLPYVDINSHPPKHTILSGQAHLPYVDINSHTKAYLPFWASICSIYVWCHRTCPLLHINVPHTCHTLWYIYYVIYDTKWVKLNWNWTVVQLQFSFSLISIYDLFVT